jgi:uncharacterized membrane protein (UPF0127 family)
MQLINQRTGAVIAASLEVADTSHTRRKGLLGRDSLPSGAALMITRCNSIHTIGMRFPIDVAFVDRRGRVRKIARHLGRWRIAISPLAASVVEFAAGALHDGTMRVGDVLEFRQTAPGA